MKRDETEIIQDISVLKRILGKARTIWPWIVVSIIVCVSISFIYIKFADPAYKTNASIIVQDDQKGADIAGTTILKDFGLLTTKSNVDNEAEILKSRSLMEKVVKNLNLQIEYEVVGKIKRTEIFSSRPVSLDLINHYENKNPLELVISLDQERYGFAKIAHDGKVFNTAFGDTVKIKDVLFRITPTLEYATWDRTRELEIKIITRDQAVKNLLSALKVIIPNKQVSIINLTINSNLDEKGEKILNSLINEYLIANVTDKNRIADSTVKFIDERIDIVSKELSGIEKEIEGFKISNKLTNISDQSSLLLQTSSENLKRQTSQEVQLSVIEDLESFLQNNQENTSSIPASLVMADPNFVSLLNQYNEVQMQKNRMMMSLTPTHPSVQQAALQLKILHQELVSNLKSIKRGLITSISEFKTKNNSVDKLISSIPNKERLFLDYTRQQLIKQELYLFLLKKREETAISKSSTIANATIIDPAKTDPSPYKPQKAIILLSGIILGIVAPFGISMGKEAINNRILSNEDIQKNTTIGILAEIGHLNEKLDNTSIIGSKHLIGEQFRSLRTNIQFLLPNKENKTILITSSQSGEGKSFMSINLSTVLALAGKKVILLELDLRKPKITKNLNLESRGFTNYLVQHDLGWKEYIQKSGIHDHMDVIASGPIPPNPSELLLLEKTKQLFEDLRNHYDYIIVDSPPAGLVTDSELIGLLSDITLYVVRHNYTHKSQINLIEKLKNKGSLPRVQLIVNDIPRSGTNYGYSYGYNYSYYEETTIMNNGK